MREKIKAVIFYASAAMGGALLAWLTH